MASRLALGGSGSGSGRTPGLDRSGRLVPNSTSAFHIVTSGGSGPGGPVRMPGNSPDGVVGRIRRHPQPPQLALPVRCLASDATAGRRAQPCRRLPTGGLSKLSDEGFELSGAPTGPFDEFPQLHTSWTMIRTLGCSRPSTGRVPKPPKTPVLAQPIDIKWIKPSGRGLDEVQKERRIRAEQRMGGRGTGRIRAVGKEAARM